MNDRKVLKGKAKEVESFQAVRECRMTKIQMLLNTYIVSVKISLTVNHPMAILTYSTGGDHMLAKIQKWGNSQGLRITKALLADAQINIGDDVNIAAKDGALIVTPAQRSRRKYNLKDLVAKIPEDYQAKETDWGKPVGNEAW
jgi:antitoxin MazE